MTCITNCCKKLPVDLTRFRRDNDGIVVRAAACITGLALLVIALLGVTGVLTMHPVLNLGLAGFGGGLLFIGTLIQNEIDTPNKKAMVVALEILAASLITLGALGMIGVLPALGGTTGALIAGSGAIVFIANCAPYYCIFPYKTAE
jgi:hypothetical protein